MIGIPAWAVSPRLLTRLRRGEGRESEVGATEALRETIRWAEDQSVRDPRYRVVADLLRDELYRD